MSQYKLANDALAVRVSCDHLVVCPADGHFDLGGVIYDGGRSRNHASNGGDSARDLPLGTFRETVYIEDAIWGQDVGGFYCQDVDGNGLCGETWEPAFLFCGHADIGVIDTNSFVWAGYYVVGPLFQGRNCPGSANPIGGTIGTLSIWLAPQTGTGNNNHGSIDYGIWGGASFPNPPPRAPFLPGDFFDTTPPPVGPSSNPCNNGGPTAPQEFGHGTGNSLHSDGTNYHRYANDNAIGGLDSCDSFSGVPDFAECAVNTEWEAVNDSRDEILLGTPPGSISAAAGILVSQTLNVVAGGACGGIGGTGTDGEFEYGSNAAFLNVRETPGTNGGDGLQGCFGGTPNCGDNAAEGCLADTFVQASDHHASDTNIVVMDVALGGSIAFTAASDWSRPNSTSNGGQDGNTIHGQKHCGDGVIEPCNWVTTGIGFGMRNNNNGSPHAGLSNDARRGDIFTNVTITNPGWLTKDAAWLTSNVPDTEDEIDEWNQWRVGCNPLDFAETKGAAPLMSESNDFNPSGATLAGFGKTGYTGGAAGYLIVLVGWDNPGGVLHTHANTGVPTAGFVWTY